MIARRWFLNARFIEVFRRNGNMSQDSTAEYPPPEPARRRDNRTAKRRTRITRRPNRQTRKERSGARKSERLELPRSRPQEQARRAVQRDGGVCKVKEAPPTNEKKMSDGHRDRALL